MSSPRYKTLRAYVNAQPRTITQAEIARSMGLPDNTLSVYLSGKRFPNRETALRLSRDFGIALEGLLDPASVDQRASA
jgi:transcriptional regulator with XRE-family HTH domain